MIDAFVTAYNTHRDDIRAELAEMVTGDWPHVTATELVTMLAKYLPDVDPDRITVIDHGDYQGTLLFILGAEGYQPDEYWAVFYGYGSCSGCDTLQAICAGVYDEEASDRSRMVDQLDTEVLHLVQGLKKIAGYEMRVIARNEVQW